MKLIRISGNQIVNLENVTMIELKPRNNVIYFDGEGYALTPDRYKFVESYINKFTDSCL